MSLLDIFPSLGSGSISRPRGLSWTKRGPGRRHNHLTAAQQKGKNATGYDPRY
jgi:hypothetical protein